MKIFSFLCIYLFSPFLLAQAHLFPEKSHYLTPSENGFEVYVGDAFHPAYSIYVDLKVFITPSFSSESVLYISNIRDKPTIVYLEAKKPLSYLYKNGLPSQVNEQCKRSIKDQYAKQIEKIWKEELYKTKYPRKNQYPRDGTIYSFSIPARSYRVDDVWDSQPMMSGYTLSPKEGSPMGMLTSLVGVLKNYCLGTTNQDSLNNAIGKFIVK